MKNEDCGVAKTISLIGGKWTILIIRDLLDGKKRFVELEKSLGPISPRTLSIRLQELEKCGIISKKVYAEVPLHVEYKLTKKGRSLNEVIGSMRQWGEKSVNE